MPVAISRVEEVNRTVLDGGWGRGEASQSPVQIEMGISGSRLSVQLRREGEKEIALIRPVGDGRRRSRSSTHPQGHRPLPSFNHK